MGGHITDVCFMEASGAKSCTSKAELTMSVKVLGNTFPVYPEGDKLLNTFLE